jgi:hypothetical protein
MENPQIVDSVLEKLWRIIHLCEMQNHQSILDICHEVETVISILRNFIEDKNAESATNILESALDLLHHVSCTTVDITEGNCEGIRTGMKGRPVLKIPVEML